MVWAFGVTMIVLYRVCKGTRVEHEHGLSRSGSSEGEGEEEERLKRGF
mgnify:CR=1 FL=1